MGLLESLDGQPPAGVGVVDIWDVLGLKLDDCWVNMLICTIHVFFGTPNVDKCWYIYILHAGTYFFPATTVFCSFTVDCFSTSWFSTGAAPIGVVEAGGSQQGSNGSSRKSTSKIHGSRGRGWQISGRFPGRVMAPQRGETQQKNQPVKCFFEKNNEKWDLNVTWRWWTKRKAKKKELI